MSQDVPWQRVHLTLKMRGGRPSISGWSNLTTKFPVTTVRERFWRILGDKRNLVSIVVTRLELRSALEVRYNFAVADVSPGQARPFGFYVGFLRSSVSFSVPSPPVLPVVTN